MAKPKKQSANGKKKKQQQQQQQQPFNNEPADYEDDVAVGTKNNTVLIGLVSGLVLVVAVILRHYFSSSVVIDDTTKSGHTPTPTSTTTTTTIPASIEECQFKNAAPFPVKIISLGDGSTSTSPSRHETLIDNLPPGGFFRLEPESPFCSPRHTIQGIRRESRIDPNENDELPQLPVGTWLGPYHGPHPGETLKIGFELGPAERLAQLLNYEGAPTPLIVSEWMSAEALNDALGVATESDPLTTTGWRTRSHSVFDLLKYQPPLVIPEDDSRLFQAKTYQSPFVMQRKVGLADYILQHYMDTPLHHKEFLSALSLNVNPSYAHRLAIGYVPSEYHEHAAVVLANVLERGGPEEHMAEFMHLTRSRRWPIKKYIDHLLKEDYNLHTPVSDDANLEIQTTGPLLNQLGFSAYLDLEAQTAGERNAYLKERHFFAHCQPRLGMTGSLRGLPFHAHGGALNEPVVGRKIFALFPPRTEFASFDETGQPANRAEACPWPPWELEYNKSYIALNLVDDFFRDGALNFTKSLFEGIAAAAAGGDKIHSCMAPLTALQWLIFELPKFNKADYRPLLFMTQPGQALWIPPGWQHLTLNVDDAVWVYSSSCFANPGQLPSKRRATAILKDLCHTTGRFCDPDAYCADYCTNCEGRNCTC